MIESLFLIVLIPVIIIGSFLFTNRVMLFLLAQAEKKEISGRARQHISNFRATIGNRDLSAPQLLGLMIGLMVLCVVFIFFLHFIVGKYLVQGG